MAIEQLNPDTGPCAFDDLIVEVTIKGRSVTGRIRAIAIRELRIRVSTFCPRWSSVGVHMSGRKERIDVVAIGVVHWVERIGDEWELGIWLDEQIHEELVSRYWQDIRRELRYSVRWGAVAQWPEGDKRAIQITNYSLNGMAFTCSAAVRSREGFLVWRSFDHETAVARAAVSWTTASTTGRHIVGCSLPGEGGYDLARSFFKLPTPGSQSTQLFSGTVSRLSLAEELLRFLKIEDLTLMAKSGAQTK